MVETLRIGTRGSQLALWQAEWVKSQLTAAFPGLSVELTVIKTKGDKILDVPLAKVGGKGLFVKEIEEAILDGRVDLAVHSMKDMPAELPPGLTMGPVPRRETPNDVLISGSGDRLRELPRGVRIGTSSLRRASQILHVRPDARIIPLRGNLDTRIRKLDAAADGLEAIVLAAAGVKRLNFTHRITEQLDPSVMLPAAGQGALCLELRTADTQRLQMLAGLDHEPTRLAVTAERAFLHRLGGSCQVPIAAHGTVANGILTLDGLVADIDGQSLIRESLKAPADRTAAAGIELAQRLLARGADTLLEKLTTDEHTPR
jgi:hydroxymethylbilane synthase